MKNRLGKKITQQYNYSLNEVIRNMKAQNCDMINIPQEEITMTSVIDEVVHLNETGKIYVIMFKCVEDPVCVVRYM